MNVLWANPISTHPNKTNGVQYRMILRLPSLPDKIPPDGELNSPQIHKTEANQDPIFSSIWTLRLVSSRSWGNAMVAKPSAVPIISKPMLAAIAPRNCVQYLMMWNYFTDWDTWEVAKTSFLKKWSEWTLHHFIKSWISWVMFIVQHQFGNIFFKSLVGMWKGVYQVTLFTQAPLLCACIR